MENLSERTATELFELMHLMPKEKISKIPSEFLDLLHKEKSNSWKIYNSPDEISVKGLSDDTKNYLAYIYLNYILDDEEKKNYKIILEENDKKFKEENSKKFDVSNKINNKKSKTIEKNSKDLVVKEESSLKNLFQKLKGLIKRLLK